MPDLHAPTLRRVIEMLEGEIAGKNTMAAWMRSMRHPSYDDGAERCAQDARTLRAFRERLEREAEKAGG